MEGDGSHAVNLPRPGCVVRSPGFELDAPLPAAAAALGIPILDEFELGWRLDDRPVVGVTGTNGKSTVCELVRAVLAAAGRRPAVAGNTMFGPPYSGLGRDEADVVVAEVSTFQLEATPGFLPDAAVLTNLTLDHQERHGSMEAYGALKRSLFLRADDHVEVAVVGVDQDFGRSLAADLEAAGARVTRVGEHESADLRLVDSAWSDGSARVRARADAADLTFTLALPGRHNALNALMALALGEAVGVPRPDALAALAGAQAPPGRLEVVDGVDGPPVLVDYAHTPDGVRAALEGARALTAPGGKLRVVASTLWNYGEPHRRAIGAATARGADDLVLTLDRVKPDEPLDTMPDGYVKGAREAADAHAAIEVVPDREEAIARALGRARPGDVVAILGRGVRGFRYNASGEFEPREDADTVRAILARAG